MALNVGKELAALKWMIANIFVPASSSSWCDTSFAAAITWRRRWDTDSDWVLEEFKLRPETQRALTWWARVRGRKHELVLISARGLR